MNHEYYTKAKFLLHSFVDIINQINLKDYQINLKDYQ